MRKLTFLLLLLSQALYAQKDIQKKIQTQLIEAADGSVIELPEGKFAFDASLSLTEKRTSPSKELVWIKLY